MIREVLKTCKYDYVIFMDADAVFRYTHLPLEWLFNYWNLAVETLIAMPLDPSIPLNEDERGNIALNTGFIIAQSHPRTVELFDAWEDCVSGRYFDRCSKWRYEWSHEQAAFSNYMRYEYNASNEILSLSCTEANGYPQRADEGYLGEFVRHFWLDKPLVVDAFRHAVARYTALSLHGLFHANLGDIFVDATNTILPLQEDEMVIV